MRIAIVTPGYPPAPGGVENVVGHTARALVRAGVSVEVLAQERRRDLPRTSVEDGVRVRRFTSNQANTYRVAPQLYRYLARAGGRYDVVHGHSYHALTGVAAALALGLRRTPAPYVFTPHYHGTGHTRARSLLHHLYTPLGKRALEASRAVLCVSEPEAERLTADFPTVARKITVIPNAVDRAALRSARPLEDEPPTVLSVGRLEPYKRVDELIMAFGRTGSPTSGRAPQLVVIGEGPDRSRLESVAKRSGAARRVRFLGRVDDATLYRWLRTARVLCSLSEQEAYGLAPAEALVAGARVVLSDIPAHRAWATSDGVRLVGAAEGTTGTATALADALASAPAACDAVVPGWDEIAARLIDVYERAGATETRVAA
ncbi:glycosyltransferase family 4 protein [Streptomyces sp. NPDC005573]|uniref:glycosyltransferase family 4 protein n=1 Tax=Streptomyces sp. NPDC005573 TaxID=3156890 RepID=UPI0033B2C020